MSSQKLEFPTPKSDAAKELAPYLETVLMAQAAILEQLKFQLHADGEPSDKDDILDMLIAQVNLKSAPKPGGQAVVRKFKSSGSGSTTIIR